MFMVFGVLVTMAIPICLGVFTMVLLRLQVALAMSAHGRIRSWFERHWIQVVALGFLGFIGFVICFVPIVPTSGLRLKRSMQLRNENSNKNSETR